MNCFMSLKKSQGLPGMPQKTPVCPHWCTMSECITSQWKCWWRTGCCCYFQWHAFFYCNVLCKGCPVKDWPTWHLFNGKGLSFETWLTKSYFLKYYTSLMSQYTLNELLLHNELVPKLATALLIEQSRCSSIGCLAPNGCTIYNNNGILSLKNPALFQHSRIVYCIRLKAKLWLYCKIL